jgi:hypothetical protein
MRHRDPFPTQGTLRYRYTDQHLEDERKIARILLETGEAAPVQTVARATLGGDERRLRGIPAIGRGVSGAIAGTRP